MSVYEIQKLALAYFTTHGHIGADDIGVMIFIIFAFIVAVFTALMEDV